MVRGSLMAKNINLNVAITVPVLIAALLSLLVLEIQGHLTPQRFAASCALVMISAVVLWSILLPRTGPLAETSTKPPSVDNRKLNKKKRLQIILVLLWLITATWITRGGPWLPRLVGAAMLLLFATGIILRKADS